MKLRRRLVLRGIGGVTLGLPILESLLPRTAHAAGVVPPFAIFFRQANGVAQGTNGEAERFWPTAGGAITAGTLAGRSLEELGAHASRLLFVRNVHMDYFSFGDGHAAGAMQGLTARGALVDNQGGGSEAGGESVDHRIGRELNPGGRDSMVLYAGAPGGWLGGACISHRSAGVRRSATGNPLTAYQQMVNATGGPQGGVSAEVASGRKSVNDLVRDQLNKVMSHPRLSASDKQRLQLHMASVRDLEVALTCGFGAAAMTELNANAASYQSTDGTLVLNAARAHLQVAALAVSCGYTRSVSLQVGGGNDGGTRYRRLDNNALMENYHYVSHRVLSHGGDGTPIPDAPLQHSMVDRQFARTFKYLLDKLVAIPTSDGKTMLDQGICAWYNDNADGPPHNIKGIPWIIGGSAGGYLKQGVLVDVSGGNQTANHSRLLNTILNAVGVRKAGGALVDDFGDPKFARGELAAIKV